MPLDGLDIGLLPERFAFSRAMHASRSPAGTYWQTAVGSSARLAGTRLVSVEPDVVPPDVAPVLPGLRYVPPVCAAAVAATPSATASAKAFSCIIDMLDLIEGMQIARARRGPCASVSYQI